MLFRNRKIARRPDQRLILRADMARTLGDYIVGPIMRPGRALVTEECTPVSARIPSAPRAFSLSVFIRRHAHAGPALDK
jgi:hypothetical protein